MPSARSFPSAASREYDLSRGTGRDNALGALARRAYRRIWSGSAPDPSSPAPEPMDPRRIPKHVAIIMDGNGRWAQSRGLPRVAGHKAGVDSVRAVVRACGELGVSVLTLYAFSTENWLRPESEVGELMRLLSWALKTEVRDLDKSRVRLMVSGRMEELPTAVVSELRRSMEKLKNNDGLLLNLALNYGSRREIVDAVNAALEAGVRRFDEETISKHLYTAGLPNPDLVIRTSGEMRVSNFLLWQIAYAELYVTPVLWPDFRKEHLAAAIAEYQKRERRFGGV